MELLNLGGRESSHRRGPHGTGIALGRYSMVQSSPRQSNRGYTLIELLVVVVILALMLLIGLPWFMKISQRNALKSAAREIQITLSAARMTAVKRNGPVTVAIASLTPPIRLQVVEPDPPVPTPTALPHYVILPANAIQFNATPVAPIIFGADGRLQTTPLGALTPSLEMIVEGPVNGPVKNQIKIRTTRGGAVQVVTPVDWQ
jgi:prepilin-type N-terminal cleavage/methylation domain-containing protein